MKPELERGIANVPNASFKAFRLCQPTFVSHWHYHPELELVYFAKGKGMRFIGDDISLYTEGDLFLIGENLPHTFVSYTDEATPLAEAFCIQFPRGIFDSFAECRLLQTLFQQAKRGITFPKPDEAMIGKIQETVLTTGTAALVRLIELLDLLGGNTTDHLPILQQAYERQATLADASTRLERLSTASTSLPAGYFVTGNSANISFFDQRVLLLVQTEYGSNVCRLPK